MGRRTALLSIEEEKRREKLGKKCMSCGCGEQNRKFTGFAPTFQIIVDNRGKLQWVLLCNYCYENYDCGE
jgi:hypothetical protein